MAELQKFMDELTPQMEANVMRGALRAGATQELLPEVQANLMHNGSVRTGELIAGLKIGTKKVGGTVKAVLRLGGKHAFVGNWLEFTGAKAHSITAKSLKVLSFGGRFFQSVNHPGFKAKPFLRPALDNRYVAATIATAEYIKNRLATKNGLDTKNIVIEGDS